jgi:hypothetical protein
VEDKLTLDMLRQAVAKMRKHEFKGNIILRLHPSRLQDAFDLGLEPFCPLYEEDVVECKIDKPME